MDFVGTRKRVEEKMMGKRKIPRIILLFLALHFSIQGVQGQFRSPRITEHPKDVLVKKNEPTTLNCKAEGKPDPMIEWFKDGDFIGGTNAAPSDGRRIFLPGGDLFFLSVSDGKKESDSGLYWCVAKNQVGTVRSRNATLQVGVIRDEFRVLPQSSKVLVGETAVLKCQPPRGTPEPQVLWHKNGQNVVETRMPSGSGRIYNDMGNLVIKDVRGSDAGRYQCLAINIAGTRNSPEVILSVHQKPYFTQAPEDVTVLVGDTALLHCEVRAMPPPEVKWLRPGGVGASTPGGRSEQVDGGLRIKDVRPSDEGLYFCQAKNDLGSIMGEARLTVYSRPKFTTRPQDVRIGLNGVAKFECSASGNPTPEIVWRKEGSTKYFLQQGSSNSRVQLQASSPSPLGMGRGTLLIQGVKREDSGVYVCSALSAAGSRDAIVRLEVTSQDQLQPPIINILPTNQTLPIKSMANIPCEAVQPGGGGPSQGPSSSAFPTPTVKWLKNGMELDFDERISVAQNGTLHISDLRTKDSGVYACIATSPSGEITASATLTVESPTNPNIAFHRTNIALLPPPPSQPVLVNDTTPGQITLSWTWGNGGGKVPSSLPSSRITSQPLLGFSVEAYSPQLGTGWMILGQRIYGGTRMGEVIIHTVDGLRADTSYVFVIRAENMEGFSVPSPASDSIRTKPRQSSKGRENELEDEEARNQLTASDIELISAEPASSTSIRISWKVSRPYIKYIDGYYIRYREIPDASSDASLLPFNILTVVAQKNDFDAYSHVIQNLKKSSKYQVFVAPFYKSVEGQPSNTRMISTADDRPSAPPQGLLAKMMNTTAVSVRWSPPPREHHHGDLKGYRVEVRGNDSRIHAEMDFTPNISSIVLNNLTLGRVYFIRVTAFTSIGPGPFTTPVEIKMDPEHLEKSRGGGGGLHSGVTAEEGGVLGGSGILKEVWFIILMGVLFFILLLLLSIILYTRRKSHGKKDHISSVAVAPHHPDSQFVSGKSLWIDQRWRPSDASDKDSSRSETKLLSGHHHPHHPMLNGELTEATDYAEVDPQNLTTFYNNGTHQGGGGFMQMNPGGLGLLHQYQQQQQQGQDLTPYATTTLIQQRRPNYDPLPTNLAKNMLNERDSDQFSSGRSKLSLGSNNFSKFKSSHASPSPSPSAPMKMLPISTRMVGGGCYPSPGPNRSHHHHHLMEQYHQPFQNSATENLYHIGEIFSPNKSASVNNGLSEHAIYQPDPDEGGGVGGGHGVFLPPHHQQMSLVDREIQSSLPSLTSDSASCNLYAEAEDVIPSSVNYFSSGGSGSGGGGSGGSSSHNNNPRGTSKNSRSTSPAYSSDSFNSGKSSANAKGRFYKGNKNKKFDNSCKSLERRHLAPLLPGERGGVRTDESSYHKPTYPDLNGFHKLSRFPRPNVSSQSHLDNEYPDWQQDCSTGRLPKSLKETNA